MSRSCIHCGCDEQSGAAGAQCPKAEGHSYMPDYHEVNRVCDCHLTLTYGRHKSGCQYQEPTQEELERRRHGFHQKQSLAMSSGLEIHHAVEAVKKGSLLTEHMSIGQIQARIHQQNREMGWWDSPREDGTLLMLVTSEIAEAMEGFRKDLMDDHLTHRKMAEVELADAMIRIMDIAAFHGFDLASAIVEKVDYNRTRADHQPGARAEAHGKKF